MANIVTVSSLEMEKRVRFELGCIYLFNCNFVFIMHKVCERSIGGPWASNSCDLAPIEEVEDN